MDWKPIESAPKDGTRVLLFPHMLPAHWEFGDETWLVLHIPLEERGGQLCITSDWETWDSRNCPPFYCLYASSYGDPTHWMPLPDPPSQHPEDPAEGGAPGSNTGV